MSVPIIWSALIAQQRPVLPSVLSGETPSLYANENGIAMLIHKNPLPGDVWWAEYDSELRKLYFVTITGQIFDYGMDVHENVDLFLSGAGMILLIRIDNAGKIENVIERKLVVRSTRQ
jgi:hypothetical protein